MSPVNQSTYSIAFCSKSACSEANLHRPNTSIVDDPHYKVIDKNTLGISSRDGGFSTYIRCN